VWDVRTMKPLHAYFSQRPVEWLDISQRGMLAVGHGRLIQVRACWGASKLSVPLAAIALPRHQQSSFCP
jgi:U3 small nucleolar RNA-associated protein 7